jgi:hypothetical protein
VNLLNSVKKVFLIISLLFISQIAFAQSITATVEPKVVRPGDRFVLSVTVSSEASVNVEQPELPNLSVFRLLNVFTSSETRSIFDGGRFQVSRAQTFNYELEALQPGTFRIEPIEVVVNGAAKMAPSVSITVDAAAQGRQQQNPLGGQSGGSFPEEEESFQQMDDMFQQLLQRRLEQLQRGGGGNLGRPRGSAPPPGGVVSPADLKDAFYIEVEVDKTKVYVGEQVTVSWYLVTRAQVSDIDTLKYPAVAGFWREDLELATRLNFKPEVINGVNYSRALLASFALFPLKAGVSKIDAYTARCTLLSMGAFGVTGQQTITKSSQEVPITVLPLPVENKPESFSGAVGEFKVSARVEKTTVETGAPFTLKIRFEGRGNAKPIDIDQIKWPEGLEFYDKKNTSKYFTDGRSFKEFEVILVPRKEGAITIPALEFAFFDPAKKAYYKELTNEIPLTVIKGENQGPLESQPLAQLQAPSAEPLKPTLPALSLQLRESSVLPDAYKIYVWSFLLLAGFIYLIWRGVKEFRSSEKRESLKKIVKSKFVEIDRYASQGEVRKAAVELTNLTYMILGELSGAGGASREMSLLLEKSPPSFRRDVGEALEKSMRQLEVVAFAPAELIGKDPKKVLTEVQSLLRKSLDYNFDEMQET